MTDLAARSFTVDDQLAFAAASGDRNPLHLDELAARRSLFGEPVVHGVHVVFWAVDAFLATRRRGLSRVAVSFKKPVFLGDDVVARLAQEKAESARIRVEVDGVLLVDIRLELQELRHPVGSMTGPEVAADSGAGPVDRSIDEMDGLVGVIQFQEGAAPVDAPALRSALGDPIVSRLLGLTRLVGMECPGLHSLFADFDVSIEPETAPGALQWKVSRADERFGRVDMAVDAGCLVGVVGAFVRPAPVRQPRSAELRGVGLHGMGNVRALVVGGSRGLGELTAKLLATGGAEVVVTWHRGRADAEGVVDDIVANGGRARTIQLDVGDPAGSVRTLADEGFVTTHLYYFSSPRIFARRTRLFHHDLFESFLSHYVTGFVRVLDALREAGAGPLMAYYPSSVAVEEPLRELTEYIVAKVAGERAAEVLGEGEPWLETIVQRLPRLPTDQTATIGAVAAKDPVTVVSDFVRRTATG